MTGLGSRVSAVFGSLVAVVLLWGCPYRSDVPLDSPSVAADPRLVGLWREESAPTSAQYVIEADGAFGYKVAVTGDEGTTVYRAHLTSVGNKTYVNLRDGADAGSYSLFLLEVADDGKMFTLHPVTENITERFTESADLRAYVAKYQDLSFFFEKPTRYVRSPEQP